MTRKGSAPCLFTGALPFYFIHFYLIAFFITLAIRHLKEARSIFEIGSEQIRLFYTEQCVNKHLGMTALFGPYGISKVGSPEA